MHLYVSSPAELAGSLTKMEHWLSSLVARGLLRAFRPAEVAGAELLLTLSGREWQSGEHSERGRRQSRPALRLESIAGAYEH